MAILVVTVRVKAARQRGGGGSAGKAKRNQIYSRLSLSFNIEERGKSE